MRTHAADQCTSADAKRDANITTYRYTHADGARHLRLRTVSQLSSIRLYIMHLSLLIELLVYFTVHVTQFRDS